MALPTAKQIVGIAREVTVGTPVAMAATIPFEKFEAEDKPEWLDDTGIRGSMAELYGRHQGVHLSEFSIEGAVYMDTIGFLLQNILGDRTTTGASDPFTHAFSTLNSGNGQPATHTITHYTGAPASTGARVYAGSCLEELTLKWNAASELFQFEAKGQAWGSTIAGATPTAAPSTVAPLASWRGLIGLGGPASGGTLISTVTEIELTLKRDLEPEYTVSGSQNPYVIQRGPVNASGKTTFITDSGELPVSTMLANTQQQLQMVIGNGTVGAGQKQLTFNVTAAAFKEAKVNPGKVSIMHEGEFDAIANTTDVGASGGYGPAKVTLLNASAAAVYN